MPLNTLPRLSQIYDNSRLFSSVSKTAVLFYIALQSVVIRCLWNYFNKAALMRIIAENSIFLEKYIKLTDSRQIVVTVHSTKVKEFTVPHAVLCGFYNFTV